MKFISVAAWGSQFAALQVEKCIQGTEVTLLFIALALGQELLGCVGSGSLCLTAGTYCISTKGLLLFRLGGSTKKWARRCSQGEWKKVDGKIQTGRAKQELQVRQGLEVIIPSVKAVEGFLGSDDFKAVSRLAACAGKERSQEISIPFISHFFGFSPINAETATQGKFSRADRFLSCVLTEGE